jgi:phosphatidylserine decarboxylase
MSSFDSRPLRFLVYAAALAVLMSMGKASARPEPLPSGHQPIVEELQTLLSVKPELEDALHVAIEKAGRAGILSLEEYFAFLDGLVTWIPVERDLVPKILEFYYIVDQAPDDSLNRDEQFNQWMSRFANTWGSFLDTPASVQSIATFLSKPDYHIADYFVAPSGWLTFNQFFAREVRPGKRPVAAPCDDRVVVSPADAVFMGQWPIDESAKITVKGITWSIAELLDGSPYADAFKGGTYMHSFLYVNDYHRYHVPVAGTLKEARNIHGRVYLDVVKRSDGTLAVVDGDTYQFQQERGLVIIDSPVLGLVAVLPIGMAQVSSVNLTPEVGAVLTKGEEFGYFLFGGSDIVMLFQDRNLIVDAEVGAHYRQGRQIAHLE